MRVKIEGTKYVRDVSNRAILCTDIKEKQNYELEMQRYKDNIRRDDEINSLKQELEELKSLLKAMTNRGQDG